MEEQPTPEVQRGPLTRFRNISKAFLTGGKKLLFNLVKTFGGFSMWLFSKIGREIRQNGTQWSLVSLNALWKAFVNLVKVLGAFASIYIAYKVYELTKIQIYRATVSGYATQQAWLFEQITKEINGAKEQGRYPPPLGKKFKLSSLTEDWISYVSHSFEPYPKLIFSIRSANLGIQGELEEFFNLLFPDTQESNFIVSPERGSLLIFLESLEIDMARINKTSNFAYADLSNVTFKNEFNLEGANLEYSYFKNAVLSNVRLADANLKEARFENSDLSYSDLSGSKLVKSTLKNTHLISTNLGLADLTKVNIKAQSSLVGADFTGAILNGATIEKSCLDNAIFESTDLATATIKFSVLTDAIINIYEPVLIEDASFQGSNIDEANWGEKNYKPIFEKSGFEINQNFLEELEKDTTREALFKKINPILFLFEEDEDTFIEAIEKKIEEKLPHFEKNYLLENALIYKNLRC